MAKIFIGVGHGGEDSGAVNGKFIEKNMNLITAKACYDYLKDNHIDVKISRDRDADYGINKRVSDANNWKADYFVEIHYNSYSDNTACGTEVYVSKSGRGNTIGNNILNEIVSLGFKNRGIKTKLNSNGNDYFGVIRDTTAPAVLVECCFLSSNDDLKLADTAEKQQEIGFRIAQGILKTLNMADNGISNSNMASNNSTLIDIDGKWGEKTTLAAQKAFKTVEDGKVSNQWKIYKEKNKGCTTGWDWYKKPNGKGSLLIKAIQKWCGMSEKEQDGEIGDKTITALQKKLNCSIVDGYFSYPSEVIKAFQKEINNMNSKN